MKNAWLFGIIVLSFGCKEPKPKPAEVTVAADSLVVNFPKQTERLVQFDPAFVEEYQFEDWEALMNFKRDFENLQSLNPKGLTVFLRGLDNQTQRLLASDFPKAFDNPPIKSRLQVVRTDILKCIYYAENRQNESLDQALRAMYVSYTAFLERLISMGEEKNINVLQRLD